MTGYNILQNKTIPGLFIVGIMLIILGIDGFLFVSSDIHEHCPFNSRLGHEVYADSYPPCEIASYVMTVSGALFVTGIGVLVFGIVKKLKQN